jgi:hypothetical protein
MNRKRALGYTAAGVAGVAALYLTQSCIVTSPMALIGNVFRTEQPKLQPEVATSTHDPMDTVIPRFADSLRCRGLDEQADRLELIMDQRGTSVLSYFD